MSEEWKPTESRAELSEHYIQIDPCSLDIFGEVIACGHWEGPASECPSVEEIMQPAYLFQGDFSSYAQEALIARQYYGVPRVDQRFPRGAFDRARKSDPPQPLDQRSEDEP